VVGIRQLGPRGRRERSIDVAVRYYLGSRIMWVDNWYLTAVWRSPCVLFTELERLWCKMATVNRDRCREIDWNWTWLELDW